MARLKLFSPVDGITESDIKTRDYIEKYHAKSYDEFMADETDFRVFMNLTNLSTGIISWYPFLKDVNGCPIADALIVGAGFGTVAGMLCEKCHHVVATERLGFRAESMSERLFYCNNLDILAGDLSDEDFFDKVLEASGDYNGCGYDYIFISGILELQGYPENRRDKEPYINYLKKIARLLKDNGKVIIAADNRFGLRYFCGAPDYFTGRAFDGIAGYPQGTRGYSFSRAELKDIVDRAGFVDSKFYYPLPDYRLPQLIYSDDYPPELNIKERLIPYYFRTDTLVATELELYYDVVENEVFSFVANSFIIECEKMRDNGTHVVYAALSVDRGIDVSFATCICKKDEVLSVNKQPIFNEGLAAAKKVYNNIKYLKERGLHIVPHTYEPNGSISMPYISLPTVSNYIKNVVKSGEDISIIYEILDNIWGDILTSADESSQLADIFAQENIPDNIWGPILKTAFLELIPMNSFLNPESKEILYFDQEYTMENYPAGYVMYRGIRYLYFFTPGLEEKIPRNELLERYGMSDTWFFYEQEELRFLSRVRQHERYKVFYKQTYVNHDVICDNISLASKLK